MLMKMLRQMNLIIKKLYIFSITYPKLRSTADIMRITPIADEKPTINASKNRMYEEQFL